MSIPLPDVEGPQMQMQVVDHINTAMAQITVRDLSAWQCALLMSIKSIYPLIIFILVALERTHCDRGFMITTTRAGPTERALEPVAIDIHHTCAVVPELS